MPESEAESLTCFVVVPHVAKFQGTRTAVNAACRRAGFRFVSLDERQANGLPSREWLTGQLAQSDCVIVDFSEPNETAYFELGIAQAMGKAVFAILQSAVQLAVPADWVDALLVYKNTKIGHRNLTQALTRTLTTFRRTPRGAQLAQAGRAPTPFFIDWDSLDPADAENLCRELLSQMGLRRLEWYKDSRELDLVAEYPRKDPDGFEYRELWLVSMGVRAPLEMFADMIGPDPELFLRHVLRDDERFRRIAYGDEEATVTLLLIALRNSRPSPELDNLRRRFSSRGRKRGPLLNFRLRFWDREYLTSLIQQFPNIGFKYFSDEARSLAKFRKGPEELYRENLLLNQDLTQANLALKEEQGRRIRAERDAVWKDISFDAAHKIGNPIFAIETDLDPLQKRINENRTLEALEVIQNIRSAVEKAKNIVDQFKSLTKAQEVNPVHTLLQPILKGCCKVLESRKVTCDVDCPKGTTVLGDPDRLSEAFDELAANALHWFDKPERKVSVKVSEAEPSSLPQGLDADRKFALIHFRDNGPGVSFENKPLIFEAFFSTYDQGTGLGLALVRRIIEGHAGLIRESGVPGQGADFEIYLPLAEAAKQ